MDYGCMMCHGRFGRSFTEIVQVVEHVGLALTRTLYCCTDFVTELALVELGEPV